MKILKFVLNDIDQIIPMPNHAEIVKAIYIEEVQEIWLYVIVRFFHIDEIQNRRFIVVKEDQDFMATDYIGTYRTLDNIIQHIFEV